MVNKKLRNCQQPGCRKRAVENFDDKAACSEAAEGGEEKPRGRFCLEHSSAGVVNVTKRVCRPSPCVQLAEEEGVTSSEEVVSEGVATVEGKRKQTPVVSKQASQKSLTQAVKGRAMCESPGCKTQPFYNFPGEKQRRFCSKHKLKGMVQTSQKMCEKEGCSHPAFYNFKGEKVRRFCSVHRERRMVNLKHRYCLKDNCVRIARFGDPGGEAILCPDHHLPGMVKPPMCAHRNCKSVARFNLQRDVEGKWCAQHRPAEAVAVVEEASTPRCEKAGCLAYPFYNYEGEPRGRWCSRHRVAGVLLVGSKARKRCVNPGCEEVAPGRAKYCDWHRCVHVDCEQKGLYGFTSVKGRMLCTNHKMQGMKNVSRYLCEEDGCNIIALFNFLGEKGTRFCYTHKYPGMLNRNARRASKKCEEEGCEVYPVCNTVGERGGRFCWAHRLEHMVDVVNKMCAWEGCTERFTDTGEGPVTEYCKPHKREAYLTERRKKGVKVKGIVIPRAPGQSNQCEAEGCKIKPSYNFEGEKLWRFCHKHRLKGMLNLKTGKCRFVGCKNMATFCKPNNTKRGAAFCSEHKLPGMVKPNPMRMCLEEECQKFACFGFLSTRKLEYCSKHCKPGMVNVKNERRKSCPVDGCPNKFLAYGYNKKQLFCSDHKLPGMMCFRAGRKECIEDGCKKRAIYNFEGMKHTRYCYDHKRPGMVHLLQMVCKVEGCGKLSCYGYEEDMKRQRCAKHRLAEMIRIPSKVQQIKCKTAGCDAHATFSEIDSEKPSFCRAHKTDGMRSFYEKDYCTVDDCTETPQFNNPWEIRALYCSVHKKENMINVKDRKCFEPGCYRKPAFYTVGEKDVYWCRKHRQEDMKPLRKHIRRCEEEGCEVSPSFNWEGKKKRRFCWMHRYPGMVNVANPPKTYDV